MLHSSQTLAQQDPGWPPCSMWSKKKTGLQSSEVAFSKNCILCQNYQKKKKTKNVEILGCWCNFPSGMCEVNDVKCALWNHHPVENQQFTHKHVSTWSFWMLPEVMSEGCTWLHAYTGVITKYPQANRCLSLSSSLPWQGCYFFCNRQGQPTLKDCTGLTFQTVFHRIFGIK